MIDKESGDYLNNFKGANDSKLNVIILEIESQRNGPFCVEFQKIEVKQL